MAKNIKEQKRFRKKYNNVFFLKYKLNKKHMSFIL